MTHIHIECSMSTLRDKKNTTKIGKEHCVHDYVQIEYKCNGMMQILCLISIH